jgi:tetratricopeptide (TPR) repeat protein
MRKFAGLRFIAALICVAAIAFGQAKQPQVKSQKEGEAINAMLQAPDPASQLKAAEELLTKFADTEFKAIALMIQTQAAFMMNDREKVVIYGERTLKVDPKNFQVMLMLAQTIAQSTREFDLDKEEKLGNAEKLAKQAIELIAAAVKPNPALPDDQWEAAKKDLTSQAHEALAMSAMVRKKYDVAITEFKAAIDIASTPDPATQVRYGAALSSGGKHDEAVKVFDAMMADPQLNPTIRQVAQQEKLKAMQAKGGAK